MSLKFEPLPAPPSTLAERLEDLRELFEERAAILEYEGGLSRDKAERIARTETGYTGLTAAEMEERERQKRTAHGSPDNG
jgi:hypothetical protein